MARIAFIQEELRDRFGVMTLSAYLARGNHERDVFIRDASEDFLAEVCAYEPHILAFSTMTAGLRFALDTAAELKERLPDALVIMGGPHATFYPEVIENDALDAVCIGEGELALLELAGSIDEGSQPYQIKNLWIKDKEDRSTVHRNPVRHINDMNDLDMIDRDIYFGKYPVLAAAPTKKIMVGKGCPYDCSYCFNHSSKKLYKNKGKFTQFRDIDKLIAEIKFIRDTYGMRWLQIITDTININRRWFMEFLDRYIAEVNAPFLCNVRIDQIDEEMVAKMKKAGCDRVNYGVEHGNPELRQDVLRRNMSDETIIEAGRLFTQYGIRVQTANIIGIPHETVETAMESVKINRLLKPSMAQCFSLQLYPGTEIFDYCREHGFIPENQTFSSYGTGFQIGFRGDTDEMQLKLEDEKKLVRLFYLFDFLVHHHWPDSLVKFMLKLPLNRLYKTIYVYPTLRQNFKYAGNLKERVSAVKRLMQVAVCG